MHHLSGRSSLASLLLSGKLAEYMSVCCRSFQVSELHPQGMVAARLSTAVSFSMHVSCVSGKQFAFDGMSHCRTDKPVATVRCSLCMACAIQHLDGCV